MKLRGLPFLMLVGLITVGNALPTYAENLVPQDKEVVTLKIQKEENGEALGNKLMAEVAKTPALTTLKNEIKEQEELAAKKAAEEKKAKEEAAKKAAEKKAQEEAAKKAAAEKAAAAKAAEEKAAAEKKVQQSQSSASISLSQFLVQGVVNANGYKFTYYSQSVLPGGGLSIPGRHVSGAGYVCDGDGYIVAASSLPKGTIIATPFGASAKVYDRGTVGNHIDIYIR